MKDREVVSTMRAADQVTIKLEVARGRLQSIVDEAGAVLIRTAFSHVLRDAKDFACAVLTPDGHTVVQSSQSIPVFLGTMTLTARHLLNRFPLEVWKGGDVFGTNDPWLGTGHMYDLTVLTPIFVDERAVAISGVIAHLPDIGGRIVGPDSPTVFEEGLRIPPMKIATLNGIDPVLLAILRANVRVPEEVVGDFEATLNASSVIGRSLSHLCQEISASRFAEVCRELDARTESFMRAAISELPAGTYPAAIDSEGFGRSGPYTIQLAVKVEGNEIEVDFTGSSRQIAAGVNSCYAYTRAYVAYALKSLLAPALPFNEGILRPIRVTAPEGTVVNSCFPAAGAIRMATGHFIPGLIFKALSEVVPEHAIGECGAPRPGVRFGGTDPITGALFTVPVLVPGGFGARATKDGLPCIAFPTNASTVPMEMIEAGCPLLFEEKELVTDSGGAGQFQGGLGQRVTVRCLAESVQASVTALRLSKPAGGIYGGGSGSLTRVLLNETPENPSGHIPLRQGDTITLESPGGGGFGDPHQRSTVQVSEDVEDGYISIEKARNVYDWHGQ